jgi:hypothetical protein
MGEGVKQLTSPWSLRQIVGRVGIQVDRHLPLYLLSAAPVESVINSENVAHAHFFFHRARLHRVLHLRHAERTSDGQRVGLRLVELIEAHAVDPRALALFLPEASTARAAAERAVLARRRSLQDSASRLRVTSSTISITSRVWTFSSSCLALMPSPSIVIQ